MKVFVRSFPSYVVYPFDVDVETETVGEILTKVADTAQIDQEKIVNCKKNKNSFQMQVLQYRDQKLQDGDATLASIGVEQDKTLVKQSLHYTSSNRRFEYNKYNLF